MKTQTTQLSLFETKQISGGINLDETITHYPISGIPRFLKRPYFAITLALKETGGMFSIVE
jgi:hypothetical protein